MEWTHKHHLIIKNRGGVTPIDVCDEWIAALGREGLVLDDGSSVRIPMPDVVLVGSKMAVHETHRGIVDDEARDDGTLQCQLAVRSMLGGDAAYLVAVHDSHPQRLTASASGGIAS